jgi:hypothetical protein
MDRMTTQECQQRLEVIGTEMNTLIARFNSMKEKDKNSDAPMTEADRATAKAELDSLLARVLDLQAELIEVKKQLSADPG